MEEVSKVAEAQGRVIMGKWNPDRCWFCRHGRPCPMPTRCNPRNESWSWEGPANDLSAEQPELHLPDTLFSEGRTTRSPSVFTSRVSYPGADGLNVTRKSGTTLGKAFAPSWSILIPAKAALTEAKLLASRGLTLESQQKADRAWETYTHEYTHEMRESYRAGRRRTGSETLPPIGPWLEVLSMSRVVLMCYCTDPNRCHRIILASILVKCGATYLGEVEMAA